MIVTLENTSSQDVDSRLLALLEEGGVVALGRVLTLIILTDNGDAETAIAAANDASREHRAGSSWLAPRVRPRRRADWTPKCGSGRMPARVR